MNSDDWIEHIVQLGFASLKEKGIFWQTIPRPTHNVVYDKLQALLGKDILFQAPVPWGEYVFLDTAKHPRWHVWLTAHAQLRYDLQNNQGIPEEQLPVLPEGINPLEESLHDEDDYNPPKAFL